MSPETTRVKLCGTTSVEDGRMAEDAGADYIGILVDIDFSRRTVDADEARAICSAVFAPTVILTYERPAAWTAEMVAYTGAAAIQLLGRESPDVVRELKALTDAEVWKTLYLPGGESGEHLERGLAEQMGLYAAVGADKLLVDSVSLIDGKPKFGGTGHTHDWAVARRVIAAAPAPTFLSGGIGAHNAAEARATIRPFGLDLCSGVESSQGRRDPVKTANLMAAARS
ncbi:hypothetical protein CMK11_12590 [Candidatus Poribacteria bacterium]|nr:hypothetical protein [Candidatus Poribacteria bacterium]